MLEFALSSLLADDAAAAEGQSRGLTYKILLSSKQAQEARENTDGNANSQDNGIDKTIPEKGNRIDNSCSGSRQLTVYKVLIKHKDTKSRSNYTLKKTQRSLVNKSVSSIPHSSSHLRSSGFVIRQKRVSAFVMLRFIFSGIANPHTLCSRITNPADQGTCFSI